MKLRLTEALKTFGSHLLLIVLSFISLFPAFWIIMSSFKTGNSLFSDSLIPKNFTFVHYKELFEQTKYLLWFMNTLKIAALSTLLGTFCCC